MATTIGGAHVGLELQELRLEGAQVKLVLNQAHEPLELYQIHDN